MSDITELFMRDPLKLTDTDISGIIQYYRDNRKLFNAPVAAAKPTAAKKVDPRLSGLKIDLEL
jgi:hypothetical protein